MSVVITVLIVLSCVVAWIAVAIIGIRVSDLASRSEFGLDDYEREWAAWFAFLFGPVWLAGVLCFWFVKLLASVSWIHNFIRPKEVRYERRVQMRDQLEGEARKYKSLQRDAQQAGRSDEAEIFRTVAADYLEKAHQ